MCLACVCWCAGKDGSSLAVAGAAFHARAPEIDAQLDATGAGDAYLGGVLACMYKWVSGLHSQHGCVCACCNVGGWRVGGGWIGCVCVCVCVRCAVGVWMLWVDVGVSTA